jgi:hypothetical protein
MPQYVVMCHRSSGSALGAASAPMRENGEVRYFDTPEKAEAVARRLNQEVRSLNLSYGVAPRTTRQSP